MYIILGDEGYDGEINYWNNEDGWSESVESATRFTEEETHSLSLPIGKNVRWKDIGNTN